MKKIDKSYIKKEDITYILELKELNDAEKMIMLIIYNNISFWKNSLKDNTNTEIMFFSLISDKELKEKTGKSIRRISGILNNLEKKGFIQRQMGFSRQINLLLSGEFDLIK